MSGDWLNGLKNGIKEGLTKGITSIGFEWAMQQMDIDPLIGSVASRAIAGAIEGLLTKTGFINGAVNGVIDAGKKTLTLGGVVEPPDPNSEFYQAYPELLSQGWAQYYWNESVYISKVFNLSQVIQERGIVPAIESIAASIFFRQTIESIWNQGGLADLITGSAVMTYNDRKNMAVKRVFLNPSHTDYIDFTIDGKDIVAIKQGNTYENSTFVYGPDGKAYPKESTKWIDNPDGTQTVNHIANYKLILSEKYDSNSIMMKSVYPRTGQVGIVIDDNGKVLDGHVIDFENGYEYKMDKGKMVEFVDKNFFSENDNRSFLGIGGGAYFKDRLSLDEYTETDLSNLSLKIKDNNGEIEVSVDLNNPTKPVSIATLSAYQKLAKYIKQTFISSIAQGDLFDSTSDKFITGVNSYILIDRISGQGVTEVYENGLKLLGEIEAGGWDGPTRGYTKVVNGGIVYDIDANSYLTVKIDNRSPTYMQYRGSSNLAAFTGTKDENDKLINGELNIMGRDVIVFQNGTPIGYYKTSDPNHSINLLTYDKIVSLVTNIIDGNAQISQNGIGNGMPSGVEPDFQAYHNAVIARYNELFPSDSLITNATLPVFLNSEAGFEGVHQYLDMIRDTVGGVAMNQIIDQLTDETRTRFNEVYGGSYNYDPLEGYTRIFESGSKTCSIRQINEDSHRVYTMIGVSGNMSDKISNPYTKLFVNFTSNNGEPPFVRNYNVADIFRYPNEDKQVFNIQFDDAILPSLGYRRYGHVDYARDPEHPYHKFFITAAALAEHAVYDGGIPLKNLVMKAKGFTDDSQLNAYLAQNDSITISIEDVRRAGLE